MSLDRDLQRQILEELAEEYPDPIDYHQRRDCHQKKFQANIFYLKEHNLIDGVTDDDLGFGRVIAWATITKDGLDFLAADGGLSAILKTVTVKFDVNNLRTVLEDKIIASHLSEEQKETFRTRIRSFSGEMLKETVLKFVEKGLERPDLWPVLMKLVGL